MPVRIKGIWAAGCTVLAVGCLSPHTTRLPTLAPSPPQLERRAYEFHDPFPDQSIGPETFVRPRGFEIPRTAARRAKETQVPIGPYPQLLPPPSMGWSYPNAVRP